MEQCKFNLDLNILGGSIGFTEFDGDFYFVNYFENKNETVLVNIPIDE